jgi:uncharacterized protein YdaU (DUF1376 family)
MHRLKKPLWFIETPAPGGEGGDTGGEGGTGSVDTPPQSFTQADVDRIVRERVQRERSKYADYDDLKAKAAGAKTLEDRIAELETSTAKATMDATRSRIAAEFGISTKAGTKGEPSDADLFLTGADEKTLRAQAERLAAAEAERKKQGPRVRNEGKTPNPSNDDPMRDLAQQLFGND